MVSSNFGIDSAADARTYYDHAVATFGQFGWIGRYLPTYALTPDERDFIHSRGTAILALWNRDQNGATIGSAIQSMGEVEGHAACAAWAALGLPKGCVIVYDVENNFHLSGEVLLGWIIAVHRNGYIPGVYLNPPNGNSHSAGYQWARRQRPDLPCVYFTSQWEYFGFQDKPLHTLVVGPQSAAPVAGYEGECHFHQSWENTLGNTIDLDVASDHGLTLLWGTTPPKPPPPPTYRTNIACALKVAASHSDPRIAVDEHGNHVYIELGAEVLNNGAEVTTDDTWQPIRLPHRPVHGFIPSTAIVLDAV